MPSAGNHPHTLAYEAKSLLKALFNHIALAFFRLLPVKLTRHLLFLLRSTPEITDCWGYHVRPIHFYEPLPDFSRIKTEETIRRRDFAAIDFNLPQQLQLLKRLGEHYRDELQALAHQPEPEGFNFQNDYFGGFDAALYYSVIRDLKPRQVIEVGSGYSTQVAHKALQRNRTEEQSGRLTCIEPFPQPRLTAPMLEIELIEKRVESLPIDFFTQLQSNDILFIDSSHAVRFDGDVCREFLEIFPALNLGVWIHVHDIFFPHDYPAEWLIEKRIAFSEQYLLEAFLSYNRSFSVVASNYWLVLEHMADIEEIWPIVAGEFRPASLGCASFWMRKVA